MADDPSFDPVKIRAFVLGLVTIWMTVDDVQRELLAAREKSGDKPAHVPIQIVQTSLNQLVEQGGIVERKEQGKPIAYRLNRRALVARRAKILETLLFESDSSDRESKLLERTGASVADLNELVEQGLVTRKVGEHGALIVIGSKVAVDVVRLGSEAVVGALVPADADDKKPGEDFGANAVKRIAELTEEARIAKNQLQRARLWLASNGVTIEGIIEPPPPPPRRVTFEHTETREIDDAEKGRILGEVLKLDEARALVQLRIDQAKSQGKADLERIDAEIAALKSAAHDSVRVVATLAYKDVDWDAKAVLIRAVDDDRVLKTMPIPKGEQKPLPGTDATAKETGPTPTLPAKTDAADAADPRPRFSDPGAAVLEVLRAAAGPLTADEIGKRIGEGFREVPEGLAGLLKIQLHQFVRGKSLAKDKKTEAYAIVAGSPAALPPAPTPAPAAPGTEGEDGLEPGADPNVEPGPLASPERRRKGKKKPSGDEARP